jgi:hypothetical protein
VYLYLHAQRGMRDICFYIILSHVLSVIILADLVLSAFTRLECLQMGCGLIGFIGLLKIVTTNNYSAIADSHNLQSKYFTHQPAVSPSVVW